MMEPWPISSTPMMQRRAFLAASLLITSCLQAQEAVWPTRPLRLLVGSNPGGGTDAMARAVADPLAPLLGQPVLVENRTGVSNTLAVDMAVKSTDGHTAVMGVVTAHAIAPHLLKLGYDNNRDLTPVAYVGSVPNVLVVGQSVTAHTVAELIALAKATPGRINFASSGIGSTQHIAAEMFKDAAGIQITHIPYKGSAAALVDLVSGQVHMSFDTMPSVINHIKSGKLRALAVTSPARNAQLPDVPTLAESGIQGVEIAAWYGIYLPASAPPAAVQRLHAEVGTVIVMPETQKRLHAVGAELTSMSQADFAAFHLAEYQRFGDIIRKNHISIE